MTGQQPAESAVIYNDGGTVPRRSCPNHTHRRPIHPATLTRYVYVREQREREHADHYMPEVGCPLCYRPAQTGGDA